MSDNLKVGEFSVKLLHGDWWIMTKNWSDGPYRDVDNAIQEMHKLHAKKRQSDDVDISLGLSNDKKSSMYDISLGLLTECNPEEIRNYTVLWGLNETNSVKNCINYYADIEIAAVNYKRLKRHAEKGAINYVHLKKSGAFLESYVVTAE